VPESEAEDLIWVPSLELLRQYTQPDWQKVLKANSLSELTERGKEWRLQREQPLKFNLDLTLTHYTDIGVQRFGAFGETADRSIYCTLI
jgi:hypothetical protein